MREAWVPISADCVGKIIYNRHQRNNDFVWLMLQECFCFCSWQKHTCASKTSIAWRPIHSGLDLELYFTKGCVLPCRRRFLRQEKIVLIEDWAQNRKCLATLRFSTFMTGIPILMSGALWKLASPFRMQSWCIIMSNRGTLTFWVHGTLLPQPIFQILFSNFPNV